MCVCVCVCVLRGSYVNTRGYAHVPMYKEMSVYDLYEEGMQEAVGGGEDRENRAHTGSQSMSEQNQIIN